MLTRADLQLPPVSLVVLGFVMSGEAALDILVERCLGDQWLAKVTPMRRTQIEGVFQERRAYNADITRLQCANLDDRTAIAAKVPALWRAAGSSSRKQFEERAHLIKRLRNNLAHGGGLLDAQPDPRRAVAIFADVRAFAASLWAVVERDDALFDAFVRTSIRLMESNIVLAGPGAAAEFPLVMPIHVLTAWNPDGEVRSLRHNRAANRRLEARLRDLGCTPVVVVGWAGEWAEESFAVAGFLAEEACSVGAEFGQAAVFEIDHTELRVLGCPTGAVLRRRPRRTETMSGDAR